MVALASGWPGAAARADGDPASDVLASQALFLPQDAAVPPSQQAELAALLATAPRGGYPIRVALIASRADLGSITGLWRQPQNYARFLGEELSLLYHGRLLVVMPNGYGGYGLGDHAALRAAPAPGAALGSAAIAAVEELAAESGHHLTPPSTVARASSHPGELGPWLVFATGIVLIAVAWIASLRARPLRALTSSG